MSGGINRLGSLFLSDLITAIQNLIPEGEGQGDAKGQGWGTEP